MAISSARIEEISKLLNEYLESELASVVKRLNIAPGEKGSLHVKIPESTDIDYGIEELASIVARTSNYYFIAARDAGIARGALKQAEMRYKRKYKSSLKGKNPAEREASATDSSHAEFLELSIVQTIVAMAEVQETALRIASESARKLLDKSGAMVMATARETAGYYMDKDFD